VPGVPDVPLELAGVVKRYGARRALDGFDLRVVSGEVFGFLGANGAGKTTAIRVALGLLRADSGSVSVLGRDPWADGVTDRARLGYLPSAPRFYERMRGADMLDHLATLSGGGRGGRPRALELLELSGADLGRPVREYSRGMRQKLGIVQAMQHEPELLVLDEPTEGLDPIVQEGFYELVRERRTAGATTLFSSHVLSEVETLCERVGMIRNGRMITVRVLAEMQAARPRLVRVEFAEPAAAAAFELEGSVRRELDGPLLVLEYAGDPVTLVHALSAERIVDLVIEKASLEDIFLQLYRDDEPRPASTPVRPEARTA
jgi:ABC-2 type transport system ATP-binding protein